MASTEVPDSMSAVDIKNLSLTANGPANDRQDDALPPTKQLTHEGNGPTNNHQHALSITPSGSEATKRSPHPEATEILRQIEYYFGDENLPHDSHLLGLIEEGAGGVSLNEVLGWKKMRKFKPKSAVREVIRQSTLVEVSADGKRLTRKILLQKDIVATPIVNRTRNKIVAPRDKPWLTKGMLKPTGFEEYHTDGPVKPAEYNQDREDYNPEISFTQRIETAVTRFSARRKMHQETLQIFSKYMAFGGMSGGQNQFTGGALTEKEAEGLTKREIADRSCRFVVSEAVMDGIYDADGKKPTWTVNFEATAKGFMSSRFMSTWNWYDANKVVTATNVLRNFFNYLILHDVCPEFTGQLMAARKVCDVAEKELPQLAEVDQSMPGDFNMACSTLFGGKYVNAYAEGEWAEHAEKYGMSKSDAEKVVLAGVAAYGDELQLNAVKTIIANGKTYNVVSSREIGVEVIGIDFMSSKATKVYEERPFVRPIGLLRCKHWTVPHAAPKDLPQSVVEKDKSEELQFLIEKEVLKLCYPGLKMEVCVKKLDLGIEWVDFVETVYPSFFTWLANENIGKWKEPGPPKRWMETQNDGELGSDEVDGGDGDGGAMIERENDESE